MGGSLSCPYQIKLPSSIPGLESEEGGGNWYIKNVILMTLKRAVEWSKIPFTLVLEARPELCE